MLLSFKFLFCFLGSAMPHSHIELLTSYNFCKQCLSFRGDCFHYNILPHYPNSTLQNIVLPLIAISYPPPSLILLCRHVNYLRVSSSLHDLLAALSYEYFFLIYWGKILLKLWAHSLHSSTPTMISITTFPTKQS